VVLLSSQAHLDTDVSAAPNAGIISSDKKKLDDKPVKLLSDNLTEGGTHTSLYVEWGGHGIHNMNRQLDKFASLTPPKLKEGFTFIPAAVDANIPDIYSKDSKTYHYQLKSIYDNFW